MKDKNYYPEPTIENIRRLTDELEKIQNEKRTYTSTRSVFGAGDSPLAWKDRLESKVRL